MVSFIPLSMGFSWLCLDGMGSYPAAREPARVSRNLVLAEHKT